VKPNKLPQVIYILKGGRLGNQLIRFFHLLAWVKENNDACQLTNVNFWQYASLFESWISNPFCSYPDEISPNWINRALYRLASGKQMPSIPKANSIDKTTDNEQHAALRRRHHRLHRYLSHLPNIQSITSESLVDGNDVVTEIINLDSDHVRYSILNSPITLLGGWRIEAWESFYHQRTEIRSYFQAVRQYRSIATECIAHARGTSDSTMLIGVLIRQDDYSGWAGGRYYFSTKQYAKFMRMVQDLYSNKNCSFLVVSDEKQLAQNFIGLNVSFGTGSATGPGHYIENLVELSYCDLILSPPSTFSVVAAYLGNVPILPITGDETGLSEANILHDNIFSARLDSHFSASVK
tara:strand:- start:9149 stop:10201 length:1053 start_codon:yes stop_codon:yes gene_type:complete